MSPKRVDTLERGDVYFFFRPKTPEKLEDMQRMFVVLSPEESQCYRLLVITRKGIPQQSGPEKNFGFVDAGQ